ncbi:hypothetical protein CJ030_MR5G017227 [Morella rubra]|uniref:Uncharacterized protein n=1 Tax=Morella rubra TaxID=262757 RepID=A0A6A1VMD4_9ROSI|nr:hypothetical protein CJ030_MR5G017227 [Morella rubra]
MKLSIVVHHGRTLEGSPLTYNGGDVYHAGGVETNFLTLVDVWDVMVVLGYSREHRYWYLLDGESTHKDLRRVSNDSEVIEIINRVEKEKRKVLHIYVEHGVDAPEIVDDIEPPPALTQFGEDADLNDDMEVVLEAEIEADVVEMEAGLEDGLEAGGTKEQNVGAEVDCLSDLQETDEEDEDIFADANTNIGDSIGGENWFGTQDTEEVDGGNDIGSDATDSDVLNSMSEREDERERRVRRRYPEFVESKDIKRRIQLDVGLKFRDPKQFKKAPKIYSLKNGFDYKFVKSDKLRVRCACKKEGCGWRIYAAYMNRREAFQIKTFNSRHECGNHYYNKRADVDWIAHHYMNDIRDNPNWLLTSMVDRIRRDFNIEVKRQTCYRARRKALNIINGKHAEHYQHTVAYVEAMMKWNPGSTITLVNKLVLYLVPVFCCTPLDDLKLMVNDHMKLVPFWCMVW